MDKVYRVMMISSVHNWQDTRVFHREAVSLARHYQVQLHTPADFEHRSLEGVEIHGLPLWHKESDRRQLRKELHRRLRRVKPDLLHFHDPELVPLGLWWRLTRRIPVVYDVHENVGASILTKRWLSPLKRRVYWFGYKVLEKAALLMLSRLILAEQSYSEFAPRNSVTVMNLPRRLEIPRSREKSVDAIYVGAVTRERGLFQLLETAHLMRERHPRFKLKVVGPVLDRDQSAITEQMERYRLADTVEFCGRLSYRQSMEAVGSARIGLALLHPLDNYLRALPTKVMEYMLLGVPFVASDFDYWRSFLGSSGAGIFVDPLDSESIAATLAEMLTDPDRLSTMGEAGRDDARQRLSWESEETRLLDCYRELLTGSAD